MAARPFYLFGTRLSIPVDRRPLAMEDAVTIPRNQSELRRLLEERGIRPRRRFGQNFLVDPNAMDALVVDAAIGERDVVLEVGPGPGTLTLRLLDAGARVLAVEIDDRFAALVEDLLGDRPGLRVLNVDILRGKHLLNPVVIEALDAIRAGAPWRVVANLPYQIASPFVAGLVGLPEPPFDIRVMVQAEVAERIVADAGRPGYGPLAATLALASTRERCRELPPDVFWPRPKVRSAVVRIAPDPARRDRWGTWLEVQAFIRDAFLHRRKTLRQGLVTEGWAAEDVSAGLLRLGLDPAVRVETVSPETLVALFAGLPAKIEGRGARRGRGKRAEDRPPLA